MSSAQINREGDIVVVVRTAMEAKGMTAADLAKACLADPLEIEQWLQHRSALSVSLIARVLACVGRSHAIAPAPRPESRAEPWAQLMNHPRGRPRYGCT